MTRHLILLLLLGSFLPAQKLDEKIQTEFEDIMTLMRPPEEGSVDETAAKARVKDFRERLGRFVKKWEPFEKEISAGRLYLGRALALSGRPLEAAPHFQHFVEKHADHDDVEEATISLGTSWLDSGRLTEAGVVLSRFVRERPTSDRRVVAEFYLAITRWRQGVVDEALTRLETVVGSGGKLPIVADAQIKTIEILRDVGRLDAARKRLAALLAEQPESRYLKTLAEQLDWYGREAPELVGMDSWIGGDPVTIKGVRGRVLVINFFADRYESCHAELVALSRMSREFAGQAVSFVGLTKYYRAIDKVPAATQRENLRKFLAEQGVSFPVGISLDFKNLRAYGVRGIPHTVVIGKDGLVVHVKTGGSRNNHQGLDALRKAIKRASGG